MTESSELAALGAAFERIVSVDDDGAWWTAPIIAGRIAELPAASLDELKIKARAILWFFRGNVPSVRLEEGCSVAQELGDSVIRDLLMRSEGASCQ
jgi:hypothetical protein